MTGELIVDAAAIGELEDAGGGVGAGVEEDLAEVGSAQMEDFGPVAAVFDLEACLLEVAGEDVGVEAGVLGTDEDDEAEVVGKGKAALTGFDEDFEG